MLFLHRTDSSHHVIYRWTLNIPYRQILTRRLEENQRSCRCRHYVSARQSIDACMECKNKCCRIQFIQNEMKKKCVVIFLNMRSQLTSSKYSMLNSIQNSWAPIAQVTFTLRFSSKQLPRIHLCAMCEYWLHMCWLSIRLKNFICCDLSFSLNSNVFPPYFISRALCCFGMRATHETCCNWIAR